MNTDLTALAAVPTLVAAVLPLAFATLAAEAPPLPPLPEGNTGIASRYPGDVGIEKDPAVVLYDGFEDCSAAPDLRRNWDMVWPEEAIRFAEEAANVHGGRKALEFSIPKGNGVGCGVMKQLKEEQDVLFLRFYSKFGEEYDCPQGGHNGGAISAHYQVDGRSTPGKRADGRNKFLAEIGNWRDQTITTSPGPVFVYCYHPEQRSDYGDHFFPSGRVLPERGLPSPFGPHFVARPEVTPELGRWYCYELMLKANTPGQRDGRIACWLDGKLVADFPNMRLRDIGTLKIDYIHLGLYVFTAERESRKWFDDVVAATEYIGPQVSP